MRSIVITIIYYINDNDSVYYIGILMLGDSGANVHEKELLWLNNGAKTNRTLLKVANIAKRLQLI